MYSAADLRKGIKIEIDGEPYQVTDFDFCKPGKGTALYRCKLKHMINGSTMDRTFRPVDKFERPDIGEREVVYSYHDGSNYVFMEAKNFEEMHIPESVLGDNKFFLGDNMECKVLLYREKPIEVTLPVFVEKTIARTEPGARGDTATNVQKPAFLDNGYELSVPLFVNQGDVVRIDTRTGKYAERVSKKG